MQPGIFQLDIYRGDTCHWRFLFWDAGNNPIDLSNVAAKSQIRNQPGGAAIIDLTCNVTYPNIVDVTLTAAESAEFYTNGITKGAWDLQLTFISGDILTPVGGPVVVTPDVTDSTQPYVDARG